MPKRFTLAEAQTLIPAVDRQLRDAIAMKSEYQEAERALHAFQERIMLMGGLVLNLDRATEARSRRETSAACLRNAIEQVQEFGCVVKDLEVGLLDFPARINGEAVYLCWRLGEDRIRFYHAQDEGFAGRKPIDPRDADYRNPIQ